MKKEIAVLIPCYNEVQTVGKVVKDYKKALPEADIYVYDNNSTDGTDQAAKKHRQLFEVNLNLWRNRWL
jgi:glycosyltransferase involved in cell wall biosynthesis